MPFSIEAVTVAKKLLIPAKLRYAAKMLRDRPVNVLDVGCGYNSCQITKRWINVQAYHGLDKEHFQGLADDYHRMEKVFFLDLDISDLAEIPDGFYDLIIFSHVIEHLQDGLGVLDRLAPKLKSGGCIYVETPSYRTYNYPSADGFLNFYDEASHIRVYGIHSIVDRLAINGFRIARFGYRRDLARCFLLGPAMILLNLFYYLPVKRRANAQGLWDLLGVATFAFAVKR